MFSNILTYYQCFSSLNMQKAITTILCTTYYYCLVETNEIVNKAFVCIRNDIGNAVFRGFVVQNFNLLSIGWIKISSLPSKKTIKKFSISLKIVIKFKKKTKTHCPYCPLTKCYVGLRGIEWRNAIKWLGNLEIRLRDNLTQKLPNSQFLIA